ncbi:MAG: hypothetical protein WAV45_05275 [Propionibacteriaceae bacterium]|nr:hypothetical protein [Micropruina sp.]HBX80077.1 hypothetical protein [Propionibacteriaceae bacterium]HBY23362.1 hypothetical protein [Propionibacteriaceae bacterium]
MLDIGAFFDELGSNIRNMIDGVENTQASSQRIDHIREKQVPSKWGSQHGAVKYRQGYSSTLSDLAAELKVMERDLAEHAANLRKAADALKEADDRNAAKVAQAAANLDQAITAIGAPETPATPVPSSAPEPKRFGYGVPTPS